MEPRLIELLELTLNVDSAIRKDAESQLAQLQKTPELPIALLQVGSHQSLQVSTRQSALVLLKQLVLRSWSPALDTYEGPEIIDDQVKQALRPGILALATAKDDTSKVSVAASYVLTKIASVDFPEQWPELLSALLALLPQADDQQLHGVLRVLSDLVDEAFDEEQFGRSAADLIAGVRRVAVDTGKDCMSRALAIAIFRSCLDTIEAVLQTEAEAAQNFLQSSAEGWVPFFVETIQAPMPPVPSDHDEASTPVAKEWRGTIAIKIQAVKALDKLQSIFPQSLATHISAILSAVWSALHSHLHPYQILYAGHELLETLLDSADRLPISLDLLVMEELDYLDALLATKAVKQRLKLDQASSANSFAISQPAELSLQGILRLIVGYAHATAENLSMWEFDINAFLAEEEAETAQYSARNASANIVVRLCDNKWPVFTSLLDVARSAFQKTPHDTKEQEAVLYVVSQALEEYRSCDKVATFDELAPYLEMTKHAMASSEDDVFRSRGYLTAGYVTTAPSKTLESFVPELVLKTIHAVREDESELVQVSAIKSLQRYLKVAPQSMIPQLQSETVTVISFFLSSHDLSSISDEEDLLTTLASTLRDAISTDPKLCLAHPAIDVLFTLASYGAKSWHVTDILTEAFDSAVTAMSEQGLEQYGLFCNKVIPSLISGLDSATASDDTALSDVSASFLAALTEHGTSPLPPGFVTAIVPKLNHLLFLDLEFALHQSATLTIKHIVAHDADQLFGWIDPASGKGGLEIALMIIDRLLGPNVEESSAAEVGGLAVELVEKAGADRLGPFLLQLLTVVAVRLSTAERADFLQNLVLVFARLSLTNAKDVLDFLAQVQVPGPSGGNGLEVVMRRWLDNSITFSGYDAIRQNIVALTNIFRLNDERLASIQTKGDLLVDNESRIKTRSQAKKRPDQYAYIPVPLKIVKVLVQELIVTSSSTGAGMGLRPSNFKSGTNGTSYQGQVIQDGTNGEYGDEVDDDDDEWEDEPAIMDLASHGTRNNLMSFMDSMNEWQLHQADDATQQYLVEFFTNASQDQSLQQIYQGLNETEKKKLDSLHARQRT